MQHQIHNPFSMNNMAASLNAAGTGGQQSANVGHATGYGTNTMDTCVNSQGHNRHPQSHYYFTSFDFTYGLKYCSTSPTFSMGDGDRPPVALLGATGKPSTWLLSEKLGELPPLWIHEMLHESRGIPKIYPCLIWVICSIPEVPGSSLGLSNIPWKYNRFASCFMSNIYGLVIRCILARPASVSYTLLAVGREGLVGKAVASYKPYGFSCSCQICQW